jgi:hypothetical protein
MLISVHVPKTGGVSFLEVLKRCYGDGLLLDYRDRPMARGTLGRLAKTLAGSLHARRGALDRYRCIHGHFLPIKYRFLPDRSFAIWLRDPVELAVSRYHYFRRHLKPEDIQYRRYFKRHGGSLEAFVRLPHFQNVYTKYLFGMRLEDFDFIGITEDYAASLELFRRVYGIEDDLEERMENANPEKEGSRYEIPGDLREAIMKSNQKDMALYRSAVEINRALRARYGQGLSSGLDAP